jgi:hypothetical protein
VGTWEAIRHIRREMVIGAAIYLMDARSRDESMAFHGCSRMKPIWAAFTVAESKGFLVYFIVSGMGSMYSHKMNI